MKYLNRVTFILLCLFIGIQLAADNDWVNQEPVNPPDARRDHTLSYIAEGKILLFGGYSEGSYFGDTWIYDVNENSWTFQEPVTSPPPRTFSAMDYIGDDKVMLYSGEQEDYIVTNDTWIYDMSDNNWTEIITDTTPLPLTMHTMSYIGENKILLFG